MSLICSLNLTGTEPYVVGLKFLAFAYRFPNSYYLLCSLFFFFLFEPLCGMFSDPDMYSGFPIFFSILVKSYMLELSIILVMRSHEQRCSAAAEAIIAVSTSFRSY